MVDEEHPTTKSDSQPLKHSYEKPKKLDGSLTTDEVTIIGNDPRARSPTDLIQNDTLKESKRKNFRNERYEYGKLYKNNHKPNMRDLSKSATIEDEAEYERYKQWREKHNRFYNRYENDWKKDYSMFKNWKTTILWLGISSIGFILLVHIINIILQSAGYPSAIPI